MSRDRHIDVLKGLGVILMILGHMHFDDAVFGKIVYAFHMPLFFMISGYLYNKPIKLIDYIKRKVKALLCPYFVFGIIYIIIACIIEKTISYRCLWGVFVKSTEWIPLESALWFLPALFWLNIIFAIIDIKISNMYLKTVIVVVLTLIGCFWKRYISLELPWAITPAFSAIGFYYIGYLCKKQINVIKIWTNRNKMILILLIVVGVIGVFYNGKLNMRVGNWGNILVSYYCAITLSLLCHEWGRAIEKNKLLRNGLIFVGSHSLIYLCINHPILSISEKVINKIESYINLDNRVLHIMMSFILTMSIIYVIIKVFEVLKVRIKIN